MLKKSVIIAVLILLFSCGKSSRFEIGRDAQKVDVKVQRFDLALISLDTQNIDKAVNRLQKEFPCFLPIYLKKRMGLDSLTSHLAKKKLVQWVENQNVQQVNQVLKLYSHIDKIEDELSYGLSAIQYYFPAIRLPEIVFCLSGFNERISYNDTILSVGTEFYLGADFPLYASYFYNYQLVKLNKTRLTVDVIYTIIEKHFSNLLDKTRLLDIMIYRGKLLYLISAFLPQKPIQDIIGYDKKQWKWATENEKEIWKTIVGKKHLYSTSEQLIHDYMAQTPFTMPISQDSPGQLGDFIGYQIVKSYMEHNLNIGLKELMQQTDAQKLLSLSQYNIILF